MLLSGCAGALELDDALAIAPYVIDRNGRIVIESRINDLGQYPLLLDTGASISVIFEELAQKAGLQPIPDSAVIVHGVVSSGIFPLLDIDRLDVGSETWHKPRVVMLPNETGAATGVDGLLGVDFMSRYAVGFSVRERVLRFYPRELVAQRTYRGWDSIPMRPQIVGRGGATAYFVDIEIEGQTLPAALDLGSGVNMINIAGADTLNLVPVRSRRKDEVTGILGKLPGLSRFKARSVRTSGTRWRNEEFLVADFEIFETFGLRDRPGAILGAGFFTQRDFVLDFARSRLLVKSRMAEVPTGRDPDGDNQPP